jgi:hypothetical protein
MRVVRKLPVPTKRSRDILQHAKGITLIESTSPLRSDGSRDDQAGEAGPVEQSSAEAKSLKTKGQGTVRLLLKRARAEAARRGSSGPNKRATLTTYLQKEQRTEKQLFAEAQKGKNQQKVVAEGKDEVGADIIE